MIGEPGVKVWRAHGAGDPAIVKALRIAGKHLSVFEARAAASSDAPCHRYLRGKGAKNPQGW